MNLGIKFLIHQLLGDTFITIIQKKIRTKIRKQDSYLWKPNIAHLESHGFYKKENHGIHEWWLDIGVQKATRASSSCSSPCPLRWQYWPLAASSCVARWESVFHFKSSMILYLTPVATQSLGRKAGQWACPSYVDTITYGSVYNQRRAESDGCIRL